MSDNTQTTTEEPKKKSLLNKFVSRVLPLLFGVVVVYFLIRDIDLNELWLVLKDANWLILLIALPFGLFANTMKAYRWRLFIRPLGYEPSISRLIFATWGSFAVNFVIPRAGEVWKCAIIKKEDGVPFTKLIWTMILDRMFDTLSVFLIALFAFIFNMKFFISQIQQNEELLNKINGLVKSPFLYGLVIGGALVIFIIFRYFGNNKFVKKIKEALNNIANDLKAIWKMDDKIWILIYSVIAWMGYFLYFYVNFYAFDFTRDLGITAGLIAFALSSISMAIPSNGGLGPWQVAVIASLSLYGVNHLSATAFATGVFSLQSIWLIIWGIVAIVALALAKKKKAIAVEK